MFFANGEDHTHKNTCLAFWKPKLHTTYVFSPLDPDRKNECYKIQDQKNTKHKLHKTYVFKDNTT
jgi:hypothetical protein